jgi:hypothetical protein
MVQQVKARVKNGRLVLDEPTDLPEGSEVTLSITDDLDDADRAALHRELDASIAEADAGETEDFGKMLTELRQRP